MIGATPKTALFRKRVWVGLSYFLAAHYTLLADRVEFDGGMWPYAEAGNKLQAILASGIHQRMHLQARRWASVSAPIDPTDPSCIHSRFQSPPTFRSYGVDFASRDGLLAAVPQHHKARIGENTTCDRSNIDVAGVLAESALASNP